LSRRANHLFGKLDQRPDYSGRSYDLAEFNALRWALDSLGAPLAAGEPEIGTPDTDEWAPPEVPQPKAARSPLRRLFFPNDDN
jgi:hypothetical protein